MTFNDPLENHPLSIAIIGMAGKFPNADNLEQFWQNIQEKVESITFFPQQELEDSGVNSDLAHLPNYVRAKGIISDIEGFDAHFFGFSAADAQKTDPQHRLALETAWQALENAGYMNDHYSGAIGVYLGAGLNTYWLNNLGINHRFANNYQLMLLNDRSFIPTWISYKLNLTGPSVYLQTACSTSLVAVHTACQSLLNGECDMALAGGITISLPQKEGYLYEEGMIGSPDGHCRAFDAQAQGTVGGNGVGMIVLKRLEEAIADRDYIHAIIKGSAINNDGSLKIGYTAPSVEGQAAVITEAQAIAEVDPETITYIEAHGTGTKLGDPIEIEALTQAFRANTPKKNFCAIGSVKSNVGHLDSAAGIAGLMKTVLAMQHKILPPTLHFEKPNPQINFADSPFFVNTDCRHWNSVNGLPRRAGVSSFGIGGTNAHVVLEEVPSQFFEHQSINSRSCNLLTLSAKTPTALDQMTQNLAQHLQQESNINLANVAYSLCQRKTFKYRRIVLCHNREQAHNLLSGQDPKQIFSGQSTSSAQKVAFMFSGQGSQYVNMGRELYETESIFRETVDHCSMVLKPLLGLDLRQILYPSHSEQDIAQTKLQQTAITQPALFTIEYALAQLWKTWGIEPDVMIGHSIGEYVAACLSGVLTLKNALKLVAIRGQLMQQLPPGSMLSVSLPSETVQPRLKSSLSVAVINHPSLCVVSGETEEIQSFQTELNQEGVECRLLRTSHAFHSPMTEPILDQFRHTVKTIPLSQPNIPYLSNVSGQWITNEEIRDPNYWANHLRYTVHFADGLAKLLENKETVLLEVGPGRMLTTFALRHPRKAPEQVVLSSLRHPQEQQSDIAFLLGTIGKLWLSGVDINWDSFYGDDHPYRIPLPTYPFEHQRYWIDPPKSSDNDRNYVGLDQNKTSSSPNAEEPIQESTTYKLNSHQRPPLQTSYVAPRNETEEIIAAIWQEFLGIMSIGIYDNFLELGGYSLMGLQIVNRLKKQFNSDFPLNLLLEKPTIADISEMIESMQLSSQPSTMEQNLETEREEFEI